jgi:hypothetical protein
MFAESHIGHGGSIEMVNFAYFGETYTNNIRIHTIHYTVSEIGGLSGLGYLLWSQVACKRLNHSCKDGAFLV